MRGIRVADKEPSSHWFQLAGGKEPAIKRARMTTERTCAKTLHSILKTSGSFHRHCSCLVTKWLLASRPKDASSSFHRNRSRAPIEIQTRSHLPKRWLGRNTCPWSEFGINRLHRHLAGRFGNLHEFLWSDPVCIWTLRVVCVTPWFQAPVGVEQSCLHIQPPDRRGAICAQCFAGNIPFPTGTGK